MDNEERIESLRQKFIKREDDDFFIEAARRVVPKGGDRIALAWLGFELLTASAKLDDRFQGRGR